MTRWAGNASTVHREHAVPSRLMHLSWCFQYILMVHSNVQMMIHTPKKERPIYLTSIQGTGQSMPMVANMQIRPCFNSTALRRSKSSLVQSPEAVEFSGAFSG